MKTLLNYSLIFILFLFVFYSCTDVEIILPDENIVVDEVENNSTSLNFHLDKGSLGIYFDVREIFRKSFQPEEAIISFPEFPQFNTTLSINRWTSNAQFMVFTDSISEEEEMAFKNGIDLNLTIQDNDIDLVSYQNNHAITHEFNTIILETEEEYITPQLVLKENEPYLITIDGENGLLRRGEGYDLNNNYQSVNYVQSYPGGYAIPNNRKFFFYHIGDNKYKIRYGEALLDEIYVDDPDFNSGWFGLRQNNASDDYPDGWTIVSVNENEAVSFELVLDDNGWYKLRLVDSELDVNNQFLDFGENGTKIIFDENLPGFLFKFISDIVWEFEDLGIEYQTPIYGPVRLDFAYRSVLSNCSSAVLTESVGRVETRTRTHSTKLTEGIQLFSSVSGSTNVRAQIGVEGKVGSDAAGGSLTASTELEVSVNFAFSESQTTNTESEISNEESITIEVSRTRIIELPPYLVVDIYDAVKTIDDITIPYVLKLKVRGKFTEDNRELSGDEIVSQLRNNWFGGLIVQTNDNDVLITIRGESKMNSLFESSSGAYEILNGCDD